MLDEMLFIIALLPWAVSFEVLSVGKRLKNWMAGGHCDTIESEDGLALALADSILGGVVRGLGGLY